MSIYIQKNLPAYTSKERPRLEDNLRSNEQIISYLDKKGSTKQMLTVIKPYRKETFPLEKQPHTTIGYHLDIIPIDNATYKRNGTLGIIEREEINRNDFFQICKALFQHNALRNKFELIDTWSLSDKAIFNYLDNNQTNTYR